MAKQKVDIVIPVYYKEAGQLKERVEKQIEFFKKNLNKYEWRIVIANNGPRKDALEVAEIMSKNSKYISYSDIDSPGRGWSLAKVWQESKADLVMYMDADLATNLKSVPTMLDMLSAHECDLVIGSRYVPGADVNRTANRYILSRGYNIMLNLILGLKIKDAQCGFKGARIEAIKDIIPHTKDRKWFFDTEIIYQAQKRGYKTSEIPVEWQEQEETSVQIISVVLNYIKNIFRLLFGR